MLVTKYRIATTLEEVDHKLKLVNLPGYLDMIKALQKVDIRCTVLKEHKSMSGGGIPDEFRHEFSCMRAEIYRILDQTRIS